MSVRVVIEGREVECSPTSTVADAFALLPERSGRGLARLGCGIGQCVACVVLVDGIEQKACLTLVRDGSTVTSPIVETGTR